MLSYKMPVPGRPYWRGMCVGVYSSLKNAEEAMARMRQLPVFRDYPRGFGIIGRILDEDYDDPTYFIRGDAPKPPDSSPPAQ
jgi:hypothetical protein